MEKRAGETPNKWVNKLWCQIDRQIQMSKKLTLPNDVEHYEQQDERYQK